MDKNFSFLIETSITLELTVAKLYFLFHELFPEDEAFWWQLALEEKNHASLIESGQKSFGPMGKFPTGLLKGSFQELEHAIRDIESFIKQYESTPPSRETAFNTAVNIENSATELHFQLFMEKESDLRIDEIFKKLNKDDKDHEKRILSYMKTHGISDLT